MKEDVSAKKRITLSNLEPTQAPTAMEGPKNSKREPRRLYKRPEHGEGSNQPWQTAYLESRPDGHVNIFVDIEIIVIFNSYPAASRL
jgi:hypothetical protein